MPPPRRPASSGSPRPTGPREPGPDRSGPRKPGRNIPGGKRPASAGKPNRGAGSGGAKAAEETGPRKLAPMIARSGLCSRRDAKALVTEGLVTVNGKLADSPGMTVPEGALIQVRGKALPESEPVRLWRYHKPKGLVTSHKDPEGRPTVFSALPPELPRVISVGRLDLNSEGLLLLTTDGALARRLEMPSTQMKRSYRVRVHGKPDPAKLEALAAGIEVEGVRYGSVIASLDHQGPSNAWLTIVLEEGKNREIRRIMEHLGYPVTRLLRVSYGIWELGNLGAGAVEEFPRDQLARMFPDLVTLTEGEISSPQKTSRRQRAALQTAGDVDLRGPRNRPGKGRPGASSAGSPRAGGRPGGGRPGGRPGGGRPGRPPRKETQE